MIGIGVLVGLVLGCDPYRAPSQQSYGSFQSSYQSPQTYQTQAYYQADAGAYAAAVAAQVRKDLAADAASRAQQDLAAQVAQLARVVTQLAQQPPPQPQVFVQPPPQPPPPPRPRPQYAPYSSPQSAPAPYAAPPVPSKQSAYGEVPPPPEPNPVPTGAEGYVPGSGTSALAVALTKCAQCHTGADAKRGVMIWESPGVLADLNLEEKQMLFDAVARRRMPPRSSTVDAPARAALATAINADLGAIASTLAEASR